MLLRGNYEESTYNIFGVEYRPNYENVKDKDKPSVDDEVNNFVVARVHMNQMANFVDVLNVNPITIKPKW